MELVRQRESEIYEGCTEEAIVALARDGNAGAQEVLIRRYKNFVRSRARSYFLVGADREDIIQEGMIGLFKAIRDYRAEKMVSFRAFAEICIQRQMITAVKSATRQKHIPLNSYISLNKPIVDGEPDRVLMDTMAVAGETDPEALFISREEKESMEATIGEVLSDLEMEVLTYYLQGKSYQQIAGDMNRHIKSIDNALQRVKRKLEKCLESRHFTA